MEKALSRLTAAGLIAAFVIGCTQQQHLGRPLKVGGSSSYPPLQTVDVSGDQFAAAIDQRFQGTVPTNVTAPFNLVRASDYGAVGDGITDDTSALQNAENIAETLAQVNPVISSGWERQGIVVLHAGKTYKISGNGLTINAGAAGWNFNGACLDARGITSGQSAITITSSPNSYGSGDFDHLCVFGSGQTSGTTGVMLAANHVTLKQPTISSFQTCEGIGDNSYTDEHFGGQIFNCGIAVDTCKQTGANKGEGINYHGTNIFNSALGIHDGCDIGGNSAAIYLTNVHLDGMSGTVIRNNSGSVDAVDSYVEDIGATPGAIIINNGQACSNQYCYVRWIGGQIQADSTSNPNIFSLIANNNNGNTSGVSPWVLLNSVTLKGFLPSASCVNGAGDTCLTGNAASYITLQNIATLDNTYAIPAKIATLNTELSVSGTVDCPPNVDTTVASFIPGTPYTPGYNNLANLVEAHVLLCNATGSDDTHVRVCLGTGNCGPTFTVKANSCFDKTAIAADTTTSPTNGINYSPIVSIGSDPSHLTAYGENPLTQGWVIQQPF